MSDPALQLRRLRLLLAFVACFLAGMATFAYGIANHSALWQYAGLTLMAPLLLAALVIGLAPAAVLLGLGRRGLRD